MKSVGRKSKRDETMSINTKDKVTERARCNMENKMHEYRFLTLLIIPIKHVSTHQAVGVHQLAVLQMAWVLGEEGEGMLQAVHSLLLRVGHLDNEE